MKIETTKEALVKAFQQWNEDYLNEVESFNETQAGESYAEASVETLIDYLNKVN